MPGHIGRPYLLQRQPIGKFGILQSPVCSGAALTGKTGTPIQKPAFRKKYNFTPTTIQNEEEELAPRPPETERNFTMGKTQPYGKQKWTQ